jgi:Fe2+ or Zn2+ uptake regulation protein
MSHDVDRLVARMREAGLKATPQRLAIVRELADDPTHPTAQELYDRLRSAMPTMSFATVYNTLSAFADAGLVTPRSLTAGGTRFDPNTEPHDHAVCDRCGDVVDISPADEGPASIPSGFKLRAVERIYRGVCERCVD